MHATCIQKTVYFILMILYDICIYKKCTCSNIILCFFLLKLSYQKWFKVKNKQNKWYNEMGKCISREISKERQLCKLKYDNSSWEATTSSSSLCDHQNLSWTNLSNKSLNSNTKKRRPTVHYTKHEVSYSLRQTYKYI